MKLCNFEVQPGHGGAQRLVRDGHAQHLSGVGEL
jgi:hypothetical protein